MRKIFTLMILMLSMFMVGCGSNKSDIESYKEASATASKDSAESESSNSKDKLTIKMLNVGQGDSILIQTKSQNILIDTSDSDEWINSSTKTGLKTELEKAKVKKIDKLILTHPHADHIGNVKKLTETVEVKEMYDDGVETKSPLYKSYIAAAKKLGITPKALKAGDVLDFGNDVKFEVLYPTKEAAKKYGDAKDYNNASVVGRLVYGKFAMLFTGDAEKNAENEILNSKYKNNLKSTVFKAPHHGSKTSAGADYMKMVAPEYVVISAGDPDNPTGSGNSYGHPHEAALKSYIKNGGVKPENIFWTFKNGTITITTNGNKCTVKPETKTNWIDVK